MPRLIVVTNRGTVVDELWLDEDDLQDLAEGQAAEGLLKAIARAMRSASEQERAE